MTDGATPAYTVTARVLHWITAVLVLGMVVVGFIIANEWGGAWQERIYNLHKSVGLTLVPIILYRLYYRITYPPAEAARIGFCRCLRLHPPGITN